MLKPTGGNNNLQVIGTWELQAALKQCMGGSPEAAPARIQRFPSYYALRTFDRAWECRRYHQQIKKPGQKDRVAILVHLLALHNTRTWMANQGT